ncbi:MAG TPA: hypothetical protein VM683_01850 [Anaeromyxobacteraceae bacterium]|jgi:hypothetical protein|nr:hypothetical protein [Anaeromyxobacteraceae bacterium]
MNVETAHSSHSAPGTDTVLAGFVHPAPFSIGRSAAGFWLASLAGFVVHGWILARSSAGAWAEAGAIPGEGEAIGAALALGLLEGVVVGAPAALLFAAAMRRTRGRAWPTALAVGGVLAVALALVLASWARAAVDLGWARVTGVHLAVAIATVAAGAAAGTLGGRGRGRTPHRKSATPE